MRNHPKTSTISKLAHAIKQTTLLLAAYAAVGQAQALILEETVVTAQKREQNLQDVGIAVTAFNGDQLKDLGFTNTTEIVGQTPSLQLYEFSPTLTVYNLRGVSQSSFADSLEAPVAVYVDGVYIASMGALNGQLFDTERVEVLRGPQGTLYGRNATGGLIHYISKEPTDDFTAYAEATVGNYDLYDFEGALSGALSDRVLARLAVKSTQQDGYLEWQRSADASGNPQVHGDIRDAYGKDAFGVKGALYFEISDTAALTVRVNYGKDDDVPTGAYVRSVAAPDPVTGLGFYVEENDESFEFNADQEGAFDREVLSTTAQFNMDITDSIEFVSITNYMDMEKSYVEDTEGTAAGVPAAAFDTFYVDNDGNPITVQSFFPDQPAGADLPVFVFSTDQDFRQITQEFRFSGVSDTMKWQLGAYYLDIDTDNYADVRGAAAWWTGGPASNFQPSQKTAADWTVDTESWSVFGQVDFNLTDSLALTVGLRWTEDEKINDYYNRYETKDGVALLEEVDTGTSVPIAPVCYSASVDSRCAGDAADPSAEQDYSDWAGKTQLDWFVNEDTLAYFGISKGIKGGNWSAPVFPDATNLGGLSGWHTKKKRLFLMRLALN